MWIVKLNCLQILSCDVLLYFSLPCLEETQAILAGYIVQGEFGDYDPTEHTPGYLDEYPFVQDKVNV